jgi:hypothetical protein
MVMNAGLQRQLHANDAERDAAMGAAEKAKREREAPRRRRGREALQRLCEDVEAQRDDFKHE